MRPTIRKVIPNRSATSLWLRAERWYVVWGLFGARTKQNTLYSVIARLGCDPIRTPRYGNQCIRSIRRGRQECLIIQHCLVAWCFSCI